MNQTILLVDDEPSFVETLAERLKLRDFQPIVAYGGKQALELVQEHTPPLIILDLRMPDLDGIDVLREVKKNHPEIKVVIMTGHGTDDDRDVCRELGAEAFLNKPLGIDELVGILKKVGMGAGW